MYTPHTVSLINSHNGSLFLVLLRGVMLQVMNGRSVQRRGDVEENRATLYVPLTVRAENTAGEKLSAAAGRGECGIRQLFRER